MVRFTIPIWLSNISLGPETNKLVEESTAQAQLEPVKSMTDKWLLLW